MSTGTFSFVTFGEAMIRIAPISEEDYFSTNNRPSAASNTLTTVGGDELNVAVALSKLGIKSEWISILPTGPIGDIIIRSSAQAGVILDHVQRVPDADAGIFFVLPEEKRVHYQRRNSAWALQGKNFFDWDRIFAEHEKNQKKIWMHVTGITPLTGEIPAQNWTAAISLAQKYKIPITMDFNHRKQLGTLQRLWDLTKPLLPGLDLLILSIESLLELSALEDTKGGESDRQKLLLNLHKKLGTKLVFCDKFRRTVKFHGKDYEVQTRFSVLAADGHLYSTEEIPVLHIPKDECGGGSAWAAGYISSRMEMKSLGIQDTQASWKKVLRRADLLAALCQETVGDHSTVTLKQLLAEETKFQDTVADITGVLTPSHGITSILEGLKSSKVVPLLRAKNSALAIERGVELVSLGCTALEVTLDTPNVLHVLKQLRVRIEGLGKKCQIGAGTILDKTQISQLIGLVDFAISPVNPPGFIEECHRHNILAIPAACSPQELWNTKLQGALVVKLFPSQLWSPAALKDALSVGPFGELNVMASGGITPEKYPEWVSAGAMVVAMGSKLCGNDIKFLEQDPQYEKEHKLWETEGRKKVELFLKEILQ